MLVACDWFPVPTLNQSQWQKGIYGCDWQGWSQTQHWSRGWVSCPKPLGKTGGQRKLDISWKSGVEIEEGGMDTEQAESFAVSNIDLWIGKNRDSGPILQWAKWYAQSYLTHVWSGWIQCIWAPSVSPISQPELMDNWSTWVLFRSHGVMGQTSQRKHQERLLVPHSPLWSSFTSVVLLELHTTLWGGQTQRLVHSTEREDKKKMVIDHPKAEECQ